MNKENVIRYIERLEWEAGQSDKFFMERNELYIENQKLKKENEKLNHYKLLYQKVKERNDKAIKELEDSGISEEMMKICDLYEVNGIVLMKVLKGNNEEVNDEIN